MAGRLIIVAAPSGGGKTSMIRFLMERHPHLANPLTPVPRYRGVAGRAANLVLHAARCMQREGSRL